MLFSLFQFYLLSIPSASLDLLMFSTLTTTVLFYILLNLPKIFPLGLRRLHDVHLDIVYAA